MRHFRGHCVDCRGPHVGSQAPGWETLDWGTVKTRSTPRVLIQNQNISIIQVQNQIHHSDFRLKFSVFWRTWRDMNGPVRFWFPAEIRSFFLWTLSVLQFCKQRVPPDQESSFRERERESSSFTSAPITGGSFSKNQNQNQNQLRLRTTLKKW